jgi:GT2 family glycosyltransferase
MTCFNRKEKTKRCLENLFDQMLPENTELQVFLCDDGSSDGTSEMLQDNFPQVTVEKGNGNLYWNRGMNLAWAKAKRSDQFDFFIWLNDDTYLYPSALLMMFDQYHKLKQPGIIVGACQDPATGDFSFGGTNHEGMVVPNGMPQEVKMINGNIVLIPGEIDQKLNGLSPDFTHYFGDYDYGLRAQAAGFPCYSTEKYIATCEINSFPYWGDSKLSFSKRWYLFHDVKGMAVKEYFHFLRIHEGTTASLKKILSAYLRVLSPYLFLKIKRIF